MAESIFYLDTEVNRVPAELSSLPEVWYLDGSTIFKNNNLGKKKFKLYLKVSYQ